MNKTIVVLVLFCLPFCALAQKKYPYEVLPGQKETLNSATDTLWVMKHSQMQKAIIYAKQNKLLTEEVEGLKAKVNTRTDISAEQDSLIAVYKSEVSHYKQNWEECDADFKEVAKKYKQQKLLKNLGLIGMAVTFVLGAYLL